MTGPVLRLLALTCGGVFGIVALLPAAEDWHEFRGPTRQGLVSTDLTLPTDWSATENVRWRTELPGQGWSSPIVVGSRIYLTAAVPVERPAPAEEPTTEGNTAPPKPAPVDYDLALFILDSDSGQVQKRIPLFRQKAAEAPKIHSKNSHASPTPIYDGTHLFLHFGHQGTACTTLEGELVWKNAELGFPPVHGNGGSPVIHGDHLIFSRDGADVSEVVALNKQTGQVSWITQRDVPADKRFSFCTPLLIEVNGQPQLIFPGSNIVQSLNPDTGAEYWRLIYDGYSVIPRPLYVNGIVFICTGYNRPALLAIDPTGSGDVTETHLLWRSDINIPHTPSLVAWQDRVAMVSDKGIAICFDQKTGEELWKQRIGGNFSASPLLHGSTLYLLSESGDCTLLDISGEPQELTRNSLGERTLASPIVIKHDLLIRTAEALYRIKGGE